MPFARRHGRDATMQPRKRTPWSSVLLVAVGMALTVGCFDRNKTKFEEDPVDPADNVEHCINVGVDAACEAGQFCDACEASNLGCVDAPPAEVCEESMSGTGPSGDTSSSPTDPTNDGSTDGPTDCGPSVFGKAQFGAACF